MARAYFNKLWSTILSNGVRQDSEGNWTVINSSTNKRRMEKTGSSVGGASGPSSQEWIPAKIYVTPEDLAEIWDCLLYTSPSPRDRQKSRMPSSA